MRLLETTQADPNAAYIAASARQERDKTLAGIRPAAAKLLRERKPFIGELRAVTALMSREGVPLLAGTDTSVLHPPGFTLHDELQALVDSGVSTADVLRAATVNPARLFPRLETGHIAPGKRADLVLLDANPLADIRNTRRIKCRRGSRQIAEQGEPRSTVARGRRAGEPRVEFGALMPICR